MVTMRSVFRLLWAINIALHHLEILPVNADEEDEHNVDVLNNESLRLIYRPESGYTLPVTVGHQTLDLKIVSSVNGIVLFQRGTNACSTPLTEKYCYEPRDSKTAIWCNNSEICVPGSNEYRCREGPYSDSIKAVTTTHFNIDGHGNVMDTVEGIENIIIRNDGLMKPIFLERQPLKMAKKVFWAHPGSIPLKVGGFFGLANSSTSCRDRCLWTQLLSRYEGYYVLDLNGAQPSGNKVESSIRFGLEQLQETQIMWSEKRQTGGIFMDSSVGFTVYRMSMCGVHLFGKISNYWEAEIDISSKCLVLPKNFWLSVMAQLPVTKDCYKADKNSLCKIKRGEAPYLPSLEFSLGHSDLAQIVRIPLEALLLDDSKTPELCIVADEATTTSGFADNPTIKFGYKVLESFYAVVDTRNHKVGFVAKGNLPSSDDICAERVKCVGDQHYIPELNYCMQPFCNIWFFKRLDQATGRCVTSSFAKIVLGFVFTALVAMECRRCIFRDNLFETAGRLS